MALAVSHMQNIPISIVSPELNTIHLFHGTTSKIIIMANGSNAYSCRKQMTHFSQTGSILHGYQLPSAGVAKNPKVWDDFEKGKKKSFGHFLHSEKESTLTKMRNVRENVNVLDRKIRNLYAEAECIKNMKKAVEYQLTTIQDDINRLKVTEMSTTEQDETSTPTETKVDVKKEGTKAKSPEKAEEKILGATGSKIVVVKEAMDIDSDESKEEVIILQLDNSEEDENKSVQLVSTQKVPHSMSQFLDPKYHHFLTQPSSAERRQVPTATVSHPPNEDNQKIPVAQQVVIQETPQVMQQDIQVIQQVPQMAQQVLQISQQQMAQQVITQMSQPIQELVMAQGQKLIQVVMQGAIPKKNLKSRPVAGCVPINKRDPKRFYCENCPHNYSTKADLKKHVQRSCLSNNPEFVCPEGKCDQSFFSKRGVTEHYYKEHTDLLHINVANAIKDSIIIHSIIHT